MQHTSTTRTHKEKKEKRGEATIDAHIVMACAIRASQDELQRVVTSSSAAGRGGCFAAVQRFKAVDAG
jgi:hypothetical protein